MKNRGDLLGVGSLYGFKGIPGLILLIFLNIFFCYPVSLSFKYLVNDFGKLRVISVSTHTSYCCAVTTKCLIFLRCIAHLSINRTSVQIMWNGAII